MVSALVLTALGCAPPPLAWEHPPGPGAWVGGEFYPTVQAAVEAVRIGGTVRVEPGEHIGMVYVDRDLTIEGTGSEHTTLRGDGETCVVMTARSAYLTLRGVTVTGGVGCTWYYPSEHIPGPDGGGIFARGPARLEDVIVEGNVAEVGGGILAWGGLVGSDLVVRDNRAWAGAGLVLQSDGEGGVDPARLVRATVTGNVTEYDGGTGVGAALNAWGADLVVVDSIVEGNGSSDCGGAISVSDATVSLEGSIVRGNEGQRAAGACMNHPGAVLRSAASDWGDAEVLPDVVTPGAYAYGADATFTCDSHTHECR